MEPRRYLEARVASSLWTRLPILCGLTLTLAGSLAFPARAQLPFPFAEPDPGKRPQCTGDYVRTLTGQLETLEKLRSDGPEAIGRLCALIGLGNTWLGKDPEARSKLRELLGADIDLERAEAQCRAGRDAVARELTTAIARLRAELLRCNDTV